MNGWLDRLLARARAAVTKRDQDAEFEAELKSHFDLLVDDHVRAGLAPDEARRQAHLALGGLEQTRELHRESRGLPLLEQFGQDLGYALRMFRRERGFTFVALIILAVGIALNTTVFSLVNTVLLRPIPFPHAERLMWIWNGDPASSNRDLSTIASTIATWEGLRETARTFEQIEAYDPFSVRHTFRLTGNGEPETILSVDVSHGLFEMLGIIPALGRRFTPDDAVHNSPYRVILSHQLWQRRFGARTDIVGQTIQVNGTAIEVIGVLPPADPFTSAFFPAVRVDLYSAVRNEEKRTYGNTLSLIGRTKPGVSIQSASSDLALAVAQLKQQYPDRNTHFSANATPLHDQIAGSLKRPLLFLWIAAGLVLAIVSFNLGGLLLARGASRRKELALRSALGAGQMRIVRQLLTECCALVAIGSVVGTALAWGFIHFLSIRSGVEIPLLQNLRLDAAALGFTLLLCVITVVLCGAMPAWNLARGGDVHTSLKDEGRGSTGGRQRARTRSTLVILEVALACVLALSAGLMVRSFFNLLKVDLGFIPQDLIAVRVDPGINGSHSDYIENLLTRVRAIPGVQSAGVTDCIPVERDRSWGIYPVNADDPKDQRWVGAHIRVISGGLFNAMGTTMFAGRDFERTDDSQHPQVVIINRTLAKTMFADQDAIGREVIVSGNRRCTVIGIVADVRHAGPEAPSGNEMYLPLHQLGSSSWDLLIRTNLPVSTLSADLRRALADLDATLPLSKIRPMQALVDRTLSSRRLLVWLIGGFAFVAVALSALGLYGLISYMVTQQTKEIGIRMALGAAASVVQREVVGRTMKLAAWGLVLGLAFALAAARWLESLLFGVSSTEPVNYIGTAAALLLCSFVAGYLPARRASRVDPLVALRAD